MQLIQTVGAMQAWADERRAGGRRIALVPTMGALHEGHLTLAREARRHGDEVVASIFVNPTQFGPGEDYGRYPRTLDRDVERLGAAVGEAITVFAPPVEEMYPGGVENVTWVAVEGLTEHLCGHFRPGHFRGVTTVVSQLFHICRPHAALFGLKDAQQFLVLRRMARDLHFGIEVVGIPTVREADGLALSSRNIYLSPEERRQATVLFRAVEEARQRIEGGEQDPGALVEAMRLTIAASPDAVLQYAEVVDVETVAPVERIEPGREVLAAVAVFFGTTRLIDNAFAVAPS